MLVVRTGQIPGVPIALTSLVGREQDLADVSALLRHDGPRLVTLTGPGGVGKTRLALRIAESVASAFPDAIAFVDLAPVTDSTLVLPTVARTLGLREGSDLDTAGLLAGAIGNRRFLLILDNLEQVTGAAPAIGTLLDVCPSLVVLATSRTLLRLTGEQEFPVAPLRGDDAVTLFVERARAVRPDFTPTAAMEPAIALACRRLDGLPLAIELAAVRSKLLSPQELADRLDDRMRTLTGGPRDAPARLQTMRAAVAWSYDLLTPAEQTLFRRLAVFAGGFTLDAAEAVSRETGDGSRELTDLARDSRLPSPDSPVSVFDTLVALVDQSLVRAFPGTGGADPDGTRFGMLETIRTFGQECLTAAGEQEAMQSRHAEWFLALAELADRRHFERDGPDWWARLDPEADNLRTAFVFLTGLNDVGRVARLTVALGSYWVMRGQLTEGIGWCEWLLPRQSRLPSPLRARVLLTAASLVENRNDHVRAAELAASGLQLARASDDALTIATATQLMGTVAMRQGHFETAAVHLTEAVEQYRALGETTLIDGALSTLANLALLRGDLTTAVSLAEEAVRLTSDPRAAGVAAHARYVAAEVARRRGDYGNAANLLRVSLAAYHAGGKSWGTIECLVSLAAIAAATGRLTDGGRLFGAAEAICTTLGVDLMTSGGETEPATEELRSYFTRSEFVEGRAMGRDLPPAQLPTEAARLGAIDLLPIPTPRPAPDRHGLTSREQEVLRLLARGRSNRAIADELNISVLTAKTHVANVLAKLGLDSRAAAAAYAHRNEIL